VKNFIKTLTITKAVFAAVFLLGCALALFIAPVTSIAGVSTAVVAPVATLFAENFLQQSLAAKFGIPANQVTSSKLRQIQTLGAAKNQYIFQFNQTQTADLSEILLQQNDVFVVTHIRIALADRLTAKPSQFIIQTYVNDVAFGAAPGAAVAVPADLGAFYNGTFAIKTGLTDTRPFPVDRCYFVPETQQTAATNDNQSDWWNGYIEMSPRFVFAGNSDQRLTINIDTTGLGSFAAVTIGHEVSLVVDLLGYNLYNAAGYTGGPDKGLALRTAIKEGFVQA
jgi:hypothetical protein